MPNGAPPEEAEGAAENARRPRHLAPSPHGRLSRSLLATVPVVLVGSIAVSIGMASPAQAMPHSKRLARAGAAEHDKRGGDRQAKPKTAAASTEAPPQHYLVAQGDTVSGIAGRFGLSTASVLALNGLSWKSLIFPGQRLLLTESTSDAPAISRAVHTIKRHTVVAGETISAIAAANELSTEAVLKANGLDYASIIYPGQSITLPESVPAALSPSTATHANTLAAEMRGNATTIIEVGRKAGVSDYGLVIAIAAAMQESGLRNLDYGDEDSLGLFQQRPSTGWGTKAQVLTPSRAAAAFFGGPHNPNPGRTRGLLDILSWQKMSVTQAAQAVQLSATPDAYAAWESLARKLVAELG